ncbi:MAG: hypothetical protein H0W99_00095 [Acidobacteria bacterium]|nr:hypothetical protein [Acidobacteriota bacterium]
MTPEEMQSTIQFILEQQAQFAVNLAQNQESISALTAAQARTDETVERLALQVERIATQQEHINEVVAVIADAQQHTDERLNALIDIVQGGRNGSS